MSHSWKIRGREGSGWLERSYLGRPLALHARLHKTPSTVFVGESSGFALCTITSEEETRSTMRYKSTLTQQSAPQLTCLSRVNVGTMVQLECGLTDL